MSIIELKEKYGRNKKKRQLYNAAIRAECLGGNELLDLLELVSKKRHQRSRSRDEYLFLEVIEDRLQTVRDIMIDDVQRRWKTDKYSLPPELPQNTTPSIPQRQPDVESGEEWTVAEISVLEKNYDKGKGVENCLALLPGRTRGSVIEQARKAGFATSKARYTKEENEAILRGDFDAVPGRTINALKIQKSRLRKVK